MGDKIRTDAVKIRPVEPQYFKGNASPQSGTKGRNKLGQYRRPGSTCYAHVQWDDKNDIKNHI